MTVIQHVQTSFGGSFEQAATAVSAVLGPGQQVVVVDYGFGTREVLTFAGSGAPGRSGQSQLETAQWYGATVAGVTGGLMAATLEDLAEAWAAGNRSGTLTYLGEDAQPGLAATTLVANIGGQSLVFAALRSDTGLSSFTLGSNGLSGGQSFATTGGQYTHNLSDLAIAQTGGGGPYLITTSATQHGITTYSIGPGGALQRVAEVGMQQSLPITTPTALDVTRIDSQSFVVVAAAGSSSLSVFAVGTDGSLSLTDHVLDSLDTRFAGATQLEVVQLGAQSFVLVSGMDDGLSLFHLTAEGRLVHADTIEDRTTMALQAVSSLTAWADGNGLDIVTLSANEAGLSRFRVDFDASGIVQSANGGTLTGTAGADMLSLRTTAGVLQGGGGDDILSDGAGIDQLRGGAGGDIFVLRADGQRDVIEDLNINEDRLDLSAWGQLYSVDQLQIETTGTGAIIRYKTEELELRTHDGTSLVEEEVLAVLPDFLTHVEVVLSPLQLSTPPPVTILPPPQPVPAPNPPEPEPEPEPEPAPAPAPAGETLVGTSGNDLLQGTDWDDVISGAAGHDTLEGRDGNDMLAGSAGDDVIRGQGGNDFIGGGPGNDRINGGLGDDTIGAGADDDTLNGSDGNDVLSGGPGSDVITGEAGNDMLAGSFGNDRVEGGSGNDNHGGGTGRDTLRGGDGHDTLGGGEGDDTVQGQNGNDFLAGGGRNDRVDGGPGQDTLNAGPGDDTIIGGVGADLFVFNDPTPGEYDRITDFTPNLDTLRLHDVPGGSQQERFDSLVFSNTDGGVELSYAGHTILLQGVSRADLDRADFIFL